MIEEEMVDEILEQMTKLFKLMSSDEFCSSIARMYRKIYESLIVQGFSEHDAMSILTHMNLGQGGK